MDSLSSILENIQPYVVVLNEVRVDNAGTLKTFFKPRGYNILPRVKVGIVIAVLSKFSIINVTTSENIHIVVASIKN